ncbi:hypothetical protein KI387_015050, partial [Taxus chinensis]
GKEKLVKRDISRGSRQKGILENAPRTAALLRAAVTGPPPCRAAVSSLKIKRGKKRGKKGKTKDTGAKW